MDYKLLEMLLLVTLVLAVGSSPGQASEDNDEQTAPSAVTTANRGNEKPPSDLPNDENPTEEKRPLTSSILGKGLLGVQRSTPPSEIEDKPKRYGFLLGHGFSTGKRATTMGYDVTPEEDDDGVTNMKRWLGDVYGGGFNIYRRSKRDIPDKRYIHYFGNVLGRGFTVGRRDSSERGPESGEKEVFIPEEDLYEIESLADDKGQEKASGRNDKRYIDSVPGYRFDFGKRPANDDDDDKRYFNSDVGGRFLFGKREADDNNDNDEGDEEEEGEDERMMEKRYGFLLGRGYSHGKRNADDERNKRYGFVLGRGFAFGKRDDLGMDKRYGFMLGKGFSMGKRDGDAEMDKRYGFMLGRGFSFGKRDADRGIDKRYGFLLGRGFSFGKRGHDARYYGHVLGSGLSFGKRSGDDDGLSGVTENTEDDVIVVPDGFAPIEGPDKRMGWMMGKGWRSDSRGNKRYGLVLGKGLSFGKRSDETGAFPAETAYFINDKGHIEIPHKKFVITQGYKLFRKKPKRYGFVLGRGFAFGKRSGATDSNESIEEEDGDMNLDKRYGYGRGYSVGERLPPPKPAHGSILEEDDDMNLDKRYGYGRGYSVGERLPPPKPAHGSILGHGLILGKRSADKRDD